MKYFFTNSEAVIDFAFSQDFLTWDPGMGFTSL